MDSNFWQNSFVDSRDNHHYQTVKIGTQIWMAENLAFLPAVNYSKIGSNKDYYYYVYGYEGTDIGTAKATANYKNYGVLYNCESAKIACPAGWHLPTDEEWKILEIYLGMNIADTDRKFFRRSGSVGDKLKETGNRHWIYQQGQANNSSGFTALPGGYRYDNGGFLMIGQYAYFWSASPCGDSGAWFRCLGEHRGFVDRGGSYKRVGFSVRCIKN